MKGGGILTRRYFMKTALKSQRTVTVDQEKQRRMNQIKNEKLASKFDFTNIFAIVAPEDILSSDQDGVVQLDPNNPKHKEIRDRWLED